MGIAEFNQFCNGLVAIGTVVIFLAVFTLARTIGQSYEERGK